MAGTGKKHTSKKHPKGAQKRRKPAKEKRRKVPSEIERADQHVPPGYNIDTIVIMPVNIDTSFVYWEVTDRLLNGSRRKLETGAAQLMVKVFEADCLKEVCSFEVRERIGKNYVNYQPSFRPLVAEIGIMNGGGFKGLLKSGTVSSSSPRPSSAQKRSSQKSSARDPSATGKGFSGRPDKTLIDPSSAKHEIWMTKTKDTYEIVKAPSRKKFTDGAAIIKYFQETAGQDKRSLFSWL